MVFSLILNELDGARFAALSALRRRAGAGSFLGLLSAGTAFALGSAGVGFTLRALTDFAILLGFLSPGNRTLGRTELDSSASRLGETDRDGLLGRPGTVLPLPHVVDFFADEFSGLG